MPTLRVQDFYSTTVTEASGIPASGDCNFTVTTPPENTNGFIVISPDNAILREVMYYHDVIGNRIYVRGVNRMSPKAHTEREAVKINDTANIFNFFSDMLSQAFYVEKLGGLSIKVWGGYVYYNGATVTVGDTTLTLTDNTTNYIKYDYPTNTTTVDAINSGNIKANIVVSGGVITSIVYRNPKESYIDFTVSLTDALPSQSGNAGKVLTTNGTTVFWGVPGANASTTVAGVVEIATAGEAIAGNDIGATGAPLSVLPSDLIKNTRSGVFTYGTDAGGDDTYVVTMTPALTTYTTGQKFVVNVTTPNTGACTIDFGPGVKNIKMPDGNNPPNGSISGIKTLIYNGTDFVLDSPTDDPYSISTRAASSYYTMQIPMVSTSATTILGWDVASMSAITMLAGGSTDTTSGNTNAGIGTNLPGSGTSVSYNTTAGKAIRILWRLRPASLGVNRCGFGLTITSTALHVIQTDSGFNQARFVISNGILYACTSNGSAQTNVNITGSIPLNDMNTYELIFTPGSSAVFYVNGILATTITTTLPTGGLLLGYGINNNPIITYFHNPIISIEQ